MLARDVFAPANTFARRIDVVVLEAAWRHGFACSAAFVVGADFVVLPCFIVAFAVYHHRRWQAHRNGATENRPADGKARDRIYARRQRQQRRDSLDMAAHVADRAGAQPDRVRCGDELRHCQGAIDRSVKERVEVVVGVRHAVLLAQVLIAPHVAAPHQEHRR